MGQLGSKYIVPSHKIGLFLAEFSAENSDIPVLMHHRTNALVYLYPIMSTRP